MGRFGAQSAPPSGAWGLLAEFEDPTALYKGADRIRAAGFRKWDCYTPFAVHGLDRAMGLKPSRVAWVTGFGAFCGAGGALLMQWWMSAVDYKIIVNGKPFWAWEQFMPVTFELGVLLASFGALLGMLVINGLPRFHHPLFMRPEFLRASDDRFFIAIEASDPRFAEARRALQDAGAIAIEEVEE